MRNNIKFVLFKTFDQIYRYQRLITMYKHVYVHNKASRIFLNNVILSEAIILVGAYLLHEHKAFGKYQNCVFLTFDQIYRYQRLIN